VPDVDARTASEEEPADGDDDSCMAYLTSLLFLLGGLLSGLRNTRHEQNLLVDGVHVGVAAELRINLEQLLEVVSVPVADVSSLLGTVVAS
jgi:hypothetical protein